MCFAQEPCRKLKCSQNVIDKYESGALCILWREGLWCYFCSVKPAYSYGAARACRWGLAIPFFFYCLMLLDLSVIERLRQHNCVYHLDLHCQQTHSAAVCCFCMCVRVFVCVWPGDVLGVAMSCVDDGFVVTSGSYLPVQRVLPVSTASGRQGKRETEKWDVGWHLWVESNFWDVLGIHM